MPIRKYKPTSPARRSMSVSTFEEITKKKPEKRLLVTIKKTAGRNNRGRITTRHRGGGAKRFYRIVDFKRNKLGIPARVAAIEYDPNRSARIALLFYADGEKRYIWPRWAFGSTTRSCPARGTNSDRKRAAAVEHPDGYPDPQHRAVPWQRRPDGAIGGTSAQLMAKVGDYAQIRMPSGEVRLVLLTCMATLGQVGNVDHENIQIGKAGRSRHMGLGRGGGRQR
jgi:large subunit ribosomal protein L2